MDGGGIRGLISAVILRRLEEQVPGWLDSLDFIAGTSTGGILALGLAAGLSPLDLQQLYYLHCAVVFEDSWLDNILDLGQILGAQFDNKNLAALVANAVGTRTLGQLKKRVLISTFDLDNESPNKLERQWKPKFFHNFPGIDSDEDALARDVALYTSAAPTYFPAYKGYIDGGVVANNPSMAALAQVFDERAEIPNRPTLNEVRLLSVGTGNLLKFIDTKAKENLDWGYLQWARPIIEIMLEGNDGIADYQCRQLLGEQRYRRINPVLAEAISLSACDKADQLIQIGEQYNLDGIAAWLQSDWFS